MKSVFSVRWSNDNRIGKMTIAYTPGKAGKKKLLPHYFGGNLQPVHIQAKQIGTPRKVPFTG